MTKISRVIFGCGCELYYRFKGHLWWRRINSIEKVQHLCEKHKNCAIRGIHLYWPDGKQVVFDEIRSIWNDGKPEMVNGILVDYIPFYP